MRPPSLDPVDVQRAVAEVLGEPPAHVEHFPVGWGNENWRVETDDGRRLLAKFGPLTSEPKWRSSTRAHELAASAGLPVVPLLHFGRLGERLLRLYDWVEGLPPEEALTTPERVHRFFAELGQAIAALHRMPVERFSSRLDGSAPSFSSWAEYVTHRLGQIEERCRTSGAVDQRRLAQLRAEVEALAAAVDPFAQPTLCHRDLHAANLLAGPDGALVAILDWDMAEAWDRAGEWWKLHFRLFADFPTGEPALTTAYRAGLPDTAAWEQRVRLVDLIESLNALANAAVQGWDDDYAQVNRRRLERLLPEITG